MTYDFLKNERKYFGSNDVPENIKDVAKLICFRFVIYGLCDPMYISNAIGSISGSGDGAGHFTSDKIENSQEIAKFLQSAYGCNIQKSEINELKEVIETGKLDKNVAFEGMDKFRKRLKSELTTCDELRRSYVNGKLFKLQKNIATLQKEEGRSAES